MPSLKAALLYHPARQHQITAMQAMAAGLAEHGIEASLETSQPSDCDFLVTWGDPGPRSVPRLVLEAGYLNGHSGAYVADRLRYISAGWNGLHGRASAVCDDCPPDRCLAMDIVLRRWQQVGDYALVCGQHPGDRTAPSTEQWQRVLRDVATRYGDHVRIRQHPLIEKPVRSLAEDLRYATVCITWNSSAAVEAIIRGIPCVAYDRGSMVRPVASTDALAALRYDDRRQWAYNLAYRMWTHDELATGVAWDHLRMLPWQDD